MLWDNFEFFLIIDFNKKLGRPYRVYLKLKEKSSLHKYNYICVVTLILDVLAQIFKAQNRLAINLLYDYHNLTYCSYENEHNLNTRLHVFNLCGHF